MAAGPILVVHDRLEGTVAGTVRVACAGEALALVRLDCAEGPFLAECASLGLGRPEPAAGRADRVLAQLAEYFAGRRRAFDLVLDHGPLAAFSRRVLEETRAVPWGGTVTYGALAARVGRPGAARAVGRVMGANRLPVVVPCHRVVAAGGLGGFGPGPDLKRALLRLEGRMA